MTMPGVQKPHWLAPAPANASAQRPPDLGVEALDGGHRAPGHPADRRHAGDPRRAVHPDRAAPALALGAAAVLGGDGTQLLAEDVEQGDAVVCDVGLTRACRRGAKAIIGPLPERSGRSIS